MYGHSETRIHTVRDSATKRQASNRVSDGIVVMVALQSRQGAVIFVKWIYLVKKGL